jgi:hypothetical protein
MRYLVWFGGCFVGVKDNTPTSASYNRPAMAVIGRAPRGPIDCIATLLYAVKDQDLHGTVVKELRERGLSVVTPGLSGEARTAALRARLSEHLARVAKESKSAQRLSSGTRAMAFREFRCDQVPSVFLSPTSLTARSRSRADRSSRRPYRHHDACQGLCLSQVLVLSCHIQATKRLDIALYKNDYKTALASIANGAHPDKVFRGGVTALVQAVEHGNIEAIVMLVKAGAGINVQVSYPTAQKLCSSVPP